MSIEIRLNERMKDRDISLNDLSAEVGITIANLSRIKTGKAKAIRLRTLDSLCSALDCQPGDILHRVPNNDESTFSGDGL